MPERVEAPGPHRQAALYLADAPSPIPADPDALVERARAAMSAEAFAYADGAAGRGETVRANRASLDRWRIRPRVCRDVGVGDPGIALFGHALPAPLLIAPLGVQEIAHPDADLATARACAAAGVPMIFSTQASVPMERTAEVMGDGPRWFQLYWGRSDALARSLVSRAEACGCQAIVVTLDTPFLGWRPGDLDLRYLPFARGQGMAQYFTDPVFRAALDRPPEVDPTGAVRAFIRTFANPHFTWRDVATLRGMTRLPLLVKGITHPDDAMIALDHGVDGIIVSNHGGRQVDGAIGAADALAEIAPLVGGRVPVLFDSGIRSGADMFRAVALGAAAVLIGRPAFHALAGGGEAGVATLIANLIADFDLTMRLAGCASVSEIDRAALHSGRPDQD